jgi:ADP-dependent NAD(P)H-hydrate dehydratase / NAD(P)H-hydrate epimerase
MKIFTCRQVREIDRFTIENEPVSADGLMERAALKIFDWLTKRYKKSSPFIIFAGQGNNGGDGLALARLLMEEGFTPEVYYFNINGKVTIEWQLNFDRLSAKGFSSIKKINATDDLPVLNKNAVVVDAIFGSGLTRPVEGIAAEAIKHINNSGCEVISIDIPSGLFGEDNSGNIREHIVHARFTLTFQFPKLALMFSENYPFTGEWIVLPIGLHPKKIEETETQFYYTEAADIAPLIIRRNKFDHKGIFGHGLLVAGSKDKAGAAVLAARSALRSGIGLLTCHTASLACGVIQAAVPETMIVPDRNDNIITGVGPTGKYSAVGVGPGTGVSIETGEAVLDLIRNCSAPMVIDADAINIIASDKSNAGLLRQGMILTPHLREFERLAGRNEDSYTRMYIQIAFAVKHRCIVVLKGAHTSVAMPDGKIYFNSTGNPGMATAGSGDVLTGIILSLLAQGYNPGEAARTGVFIHGLAGDIAAKNIAYESIIASDIIDNTGNAFRLLKENDD